MIVKYYCVFFLIVAFSTQAFSQSSDLSPRIEFFSIPNSPINSEEISDIKIDNQGYVWVVSFKGLYRYDGEKFQKISANYNSFGSLIRFHQGTNGERFVIDYWGAIYFVDNDSLFEYTHNTAIRKYYKAYGYTDLLLNQNKLHFAFNSSGYKIVDDGKIIDPLKDNNISFNGYACQIKKDRLPFIFRGNKPGSNINKTYFFLFNEGFDKIDSIEINNKGHLNPSAVVQLANNNYLLSNGKGNLIEFNKNEIVREIEYKEQVLNLFVDNQSNLWLSTRGEGIHFYEKGNISEDNRKMILPNTTSIISTQDYQNGIWLYSQNKGVGYISHPEIMFYMQNKNVKPLVETLADVNGNIVVADNSTLKGININENFSSNVVHELNQQIMRLSYDRKQDKLWISTRGDLCYLKNGTLNKLPNYKGNFSSSFSYFDSVWEDDEISLVATNGYHYFFCKEDSISHISKKYDHKLKGVLLLNDTVFVNTGNGLYIETRDTNYYLGNKYSIAKKTANQLFLFNNKLVLAIPSEGIYIFNGKEFSPLKFNDEIIPSGKLIKQNASTFWVVSNHGCFRISKIKTGNISELNVEAFKSLPRMVLKAAIIKDNQLIVQTRNSGIGFIDLNVLIENPLYSPHLIIKRVQTKSKRYEKKFQIEPILYDENNLQISFESLNYHDLDLTYRFKLDTEDDWTTTTTGYVNYASLDPGEYEFIVQSRFGLGLWSDAKKIKFEIVPPIWRRTWFIILISLIVLLLIYWVFNYRFRLINKEKSLIIGRLTAEQKALRAKMDPHFMFNVISSIQYLILRKENEKATTFLNQFSSLLRNTLNQADNEYISISDELKFLKGYINLEKMRLEDRFDYQFIISDEINIEDSIPTYIIQPFIENAIHHGLKALEAGGQLKLAITQENNFIKVVVSDNGIGYNTSLKAKIVRRKHVSHGIQTIESRLKIYNGKQINSNILIEDLGELGHNQTGTRATVFIKIKPK